MWTLRSVEVLNPTGIVACESLSWEAGVRFFGSRRELLFVGVCQKALYPEYKVSLNFNPKAQLFQMLSNVLILAEKLLVLSANEPDDAKIGSWLRGAHVPIAGQRDADNMLLLLRAEVMYLFGSILAVSGEHSSAKLRDFFDHLASVNGQNDELLPRVVESVLGSEFRMIFENLCGKYYFQSADRQNKRKEWLIHAEHILTKFCSQPLNLHFDAQQLEVMRVYPTTLKQRSCAEMAVFLPFCSSQVGSEQFFMVENLCQKLRTENVNQFVCVQSFHENLRWIEHLSLARQLVRLEAVKKDPLRSQSFFDARTGRDRLLLLSDEALSILKSVLDRNELTLFPLSIQEKIEAAVEVKQIRSRLQHSTDPQFDMFVLYYALVKSTQPHRLESVLASVELNSSILECQLIEECRL